ncbi:MAG: hypothetical protein ACRC2T_12345 [Thermoguttaceae bacterium]
MTITVEKPEAENPLPPPPPTGVSFYPFLPWGETTHPDIRKGEPFAINLACVTWAKDHLVVDYDHQPGLLNSIGYCFGFTINDNGLCAKGMIVPLKQDDIPDTVAKQIISNYPLGCSARLELGNYREIPEGETVVNGPVTLPGPLHYYESARLKGISITPYAAYDETKTLLLGAGGIVSLSHQPVTLETETMTNEDTTPTPEGTDTITPDTPPQAKDPMLARLAELVGAEQALTIFQNGDDIEEAVKSLEKATEYGFSSTKLSDCITDDKKLNDDPVPPKDDKKEEEKQLAQLSSRVIKPLADQITNLTRQVVNLSAKVGSGYSERTGISSRQGDTKTSDSKEYNREAESRRLTTLVGK